MFSKIKKIFGKEPPHPSAAEVLRLADVRSEYSYLNQVKCRSCGGPTSHNRTGAAFQNDATMKNGRWVGGTMYDHWTITCNRCGAVRHLTLAVPSEGTKFMNKMLDGDVLVVPDRADVQRRFAGETFRKDSVRNDVIKRALDKVEQKGVFHRIFTYPRILLAVEDLTFSEYVMAYFGACYRLAIKKANGASEATLLVPQSVLDLLTNSQSSANAAQALEFLLSGEDDFDTK